MKRTLLAAAVAGALALSNVASAETVNGITINPGNFLQSGVLYEGAGPDGKSTITGTGQQLVGVGVIDVIRDAGSNAVWSSGDNGAYLAFYFDNYTSQAINPGSGGALFNILFSGGAAHFYSLSQAFTASGDFLTDKAWILANGSLWMDTTAGVAYSCVAADNCIGGVGTGATLVSNIYSGSLAAVGSGSGNGFLDVTGLGAVDIYLNTNAAGAGHDMNLGSSFSSNAATAGYGASGSIDIRGLAIPEPGSLALLGLGLFGLGAMRRRGNA